MTEELRMALLCGIAAAATGTLGLAAYLKGDYLAAHVFMVLAGSALALGWIWMNYDVEVEIER